MKLCERCKAELTEPGSETRFPFPSFAVAGGVLGAAGAAMTGTLLLLPLGLITGAVVDAGQCERCGGTMDDGDPAYTLMEAGEDGAGESVFAPFRPSRHQKDDEEDVWPERTVQDAFPLGRGEGNWEIPPSEDIDDIGEQTQSQPDQVRYRYDVVAEKLVPVDEIRAEETGAIDQSWSVSPGFDLGDWQITWPDHSPDSPSKTGPSGTGADGTPGPEGGETT